MDFIFGAILVLTIACIALTVTSIRSASEAKAQARSAHGLAVRLQDRDSVEVLDDGRVQFFANRGDHFQTVVLGSKPAASNLFIRGGSITIETPATTRDLDGLYERIKKLQDYSLLRGY